MRSKTDELLYLLLWSCDMLMRPTFRNLTDSFESWAYRNGFHRHLAELERRRFLEKQAASRRPSRKPERVMRLTEAGRLQALGGRDPKAQWSRPWDGRWRLVLFDVPVEQNPARDRLRLYLRRHGFGYLQNSVWISPDPLHQQASLLADSNVDVESLLLLEARPCGGEAAKDVVAGAWDFAEINRRYEQHLEILKKRPTRALHDEATAMAFRSWANQERASWSAAMERDPLLPESLLPAGYLGRKAWHARVLALQQAGRQARGFRV